MIPRSRNPAITQESAVEESSPAAEELAPQTGARSNAKDQLRDRLVRFVS